MSHVDIIDELLALKARRQNLMSAGDISDDVAIAEAVYLDDRIARLEAKLCDVLKKKSTENSELTAELFTAREHIEHIHSLLNEANDNLQFKNAFSEHRSQLCQAYAAMMNWKDSEISSIAGGDA